MKDAIGYVVVYGNSYLTRKGDWAKDQDKARLFKRCSDAKNAMNYKGYRYKSSVYEIVPIFPPTPKQCNWHVRTIDGFNVSFEDFVFLTVAEAENYLVELTKKLNIHRDYFRVEPTDKPLHIKQTRPDWLNYFMGLALCISQRSHDEQTQHGCVITDVSNRILGTGYNGFPRKLRDDKKLPKTRPDKYPWMIHSEVNACNNSIIRPEGGIAYTTGEPCNNCLMHMWQNGVTTVYYADRHGSRLLDETTRAIRQEFLEQSGMKLIPVEPNLDWLRVVCYNGQSDGKQSNKQEALKAA
jgi:dCMP deaminase